MISLIVFSLNHVDDKMFPTYPWAKESHGLDLDLFQQSPLCLLIDDINS